MCSIMVARISARWRIMRTEPFGVLFYQSLFVDSIAETRKICLKSSDDKVKCNGLGIQNSFNLYHWLCIHICKTAEKWDRIVACMFINVDSVYVIFVWRSKCLQVQRNFIIVWWQYLYLYNFRIQYDRFIEATA